MPKSASQSLPVVNSVRHFNCWNAGKNQAALPTQRPKLVRPSRFREPAHINPHPRQHLPTAPPLSHRPSPMSTPLRISRPASASHHSPRLQAWPRRRSRASARLTRRPWSPTSRPRQRSPPASAAAAPSRSRRSATATSTSSTSSSPAPAPSSSSRSGPSPQLTVAAPDPVSPRLAPDGLGTGEMERRRSRTCAAWGTRGP